MAEKIYLARVMDVKSAVATQRPELWLERAGWKVHAFTGCRLEFGDVLRTGPSTLALIEFAIGGRVGINRDTAVQVTGERSVQDFELSAGRRFRRDLWNIFDGNSKRLRQPLEIQTNGGTMGIKG